MVEHGQCGAAAVVDAPVVRLSGPDAWTQFHSYAFDFSVWEIGVRYPRSPVVVRGRDACVAEDFYELLVRGRGDCAQPDAKRFRCTVAAQAESEAYGIVFARWSLAVSRSTCAGAMV